MKLHQFEDEVSPVIVERGLELYEAGFVTNLVNAGGGRYTAVVSGADMYEIAVQLDEEYNILSSYCDCPYDKGPVCKHEVAVYCELMNRVADNELPMVADVLPNELDLKTTLEKLTKGKLIDILIGLAEDDPTLYNELLFTYASVDERHEIERTKSMIHSIIEKYTGNEKFIYKYASGFANELRVVLGKIESLKDPLIAIEIAGLLLVEAVKSIQYTDDSGGDIGLLIDDTINAMHSIANSPLQVAEQCELLNKLIQLSKHDVFEGWEQFRIDVLGICMKFAGNEQMRDILKSELESMIVDSSASHYNRYSNERILNLVYDLIEAHDSTEEAMRFLQEYVNYPSFRKRLMQYEMKKGNFENVLALASEGEQMDKDYPGLVSRWKKWRYRAYEQLQMPEEQVLMARELLMDGHFEYYDVLKELAAGDFDAFYKELKPVLAVQNHAMYVQLIEAENDVDAILDYVRKNPSLIERYLNDVFVDHREEAIHLFETHVKTIADTALNRKKYKDVCQILRRYRKVAGKEAQQRLAEELEKTYKNRPAFLDELAKL